MSEDAHLRVLEDAAEAIAKAAVRVAEAASYPFDSHDRGDRADHDLIGKSHVAEMSKIKDRAETIENCAKAVSHLRYGPQGGDYQYDYVADYHETKHGGEDRPKPVGFKADASA